MNRGTLIATAALLLAGCDIGYQPNMGDLEAQIGDALAKQLGAGGNRIAVDCPSSIQWKPGDEFRCFAEDQRGNKAKVTVYMENDDGEYTWELN